MGGPQHEWAPPRDEFYLQSFKRLVPWAAQVGLLWRGQVWRGVVRLVAGQAQPCSVAAYAAHKNRCDGTCLYAFWSSFPALQDATSGVLTPPQLRELIRRAFRAPPPAEGGRARQLDQASGLWSVVQCCASTPQWTAIRCRHLLQGI